MRIEAGTPVIDAITFLGRRTVTLFNSGLHVWISAKFVQELSHVWNIRESSWRDPYSHSLRRWSIYRQRLIFHWTRARCATPPGACQSSITETFLKANARTLGESYATPYNTCRTHRACHTSTRWHMDFLMSFVPSGWMTCLVLFGWPISTTGRSG